MILNYALVRLAMSEPPAVQSPDGYRYFNFIASRFRELTRALRVFVGQGSDLVVLGHTRTREMDSAQTAGATAKEMQVINIPGQFRHEMHKDYDVVVMCDIVKGQHVLRWVPDVRTLTKSRVGELLAGGAPLANDWNVLKPAIDEALERRGQNVRIPG